MELLEKPPDNVSPQCLNVDEDIGQFGHALLWQESCSPVRIRDDS